MLEQLPAQAHAVLDVGCGDGDLLCELAARVPQAVGIDADAATAARARAACPPATVLHGDFLSQTFEPESFDLVCSVAALHHMDAAQALRRMAALTRPGGVVVVIGLARSRYPRDLPLEAVSTVATQCSRLVRGYRDVVAPTVWPPALTYDDCRALAEQELPGARYRRRLYWRYSVVWAKPC